MTLSVITTTLFTLMMVSISLFTIKAVNLGESLSPIPGQVQQIHHHLIVHVGGKEYRLDQDLPPSAQTAASPLLSLSQPNRTIKSLPEIGNNKDYHDGGVVLEGDDDGDDDEQDQDELEPYTTQEIVHNSTTGDVIGKGDEDVGEQGRGDEANNKHKRTELIIIIVCSIFGGFGLIIGPILLIIRKCCNDNDSKRNDGWHELHLLRELNETQQNAVQRANDSFE